MYKFKYFFKKIQFILLGILLTILLSIVFGTSAIAQNPLFPANTAGLNGTQQFTVILLVIVVPPILFVVSFWKLLNFINQSQSKSVEERKIYVSEIMSKVFETATVLIIVPSILFLTLAGKIANEGAISILSAIVGYVLGKSSSGIRNNQ